MLHAAATGREVAEVRSAVALSDDQKTRLAASLKQATGKDVDIRVTVDPSVLGGIVTTIGDTIIDDGNQQQKEQKFKFMIISLCVSLFIICVKYPKKDQLQKMS